MNFPHKVPQPPGTPVPQDPRRTESTHALVCELLDRMDKVEGFLVRLIEAIEKENEDEEQLPLDLDGKLSGKARNQDDSL